MFLNVDGCGKQRVIKIFQDCNFKSVRRGIHFKIFGRIFSIRTLQIICPFQNVSLCFVSLNLSMSFSRQLLRVNVSIVDTIMMSFFFFAFRNGFSKFIGQGCQPAVIQSGPEANVVSMHAMGSWSWIIIHTSAMWYDVISEVMDIIRYDWC